VAQSILRPWLELARISNLPTVWTNVLGAWLLVGGKWDWQPLAWLLIGGSLLYTGGMILNDAADVKFDEEHRKERPIPSGRVNVRAAWSVGLGMMAVGFAMMVWGAQACIWLTSGIVAAILFYDLYHKPWAGSVFVMGSCRTLLYLAAASAALEHLNIHDHLEAVIKAIALGGYVVGLSLVARQEGAKVKPSKVWFWLGLLGLALPSIALLVFNNAGWNLCFLVLLILVIGCSLKLMRTPPPSNIGRAVGLLLAAIPLVDALAISSVAPVAALCFALSVPLLLLWQRKIAAT
jgi:4-hydroxybenzoate polyprenyltransferase